MIQWSLTLTGNQIALLRAYRHRQFGKPFEHPHDTLSGRGYIAGTRTLFREGLMEHRHTLLAPTASGARYTDNTRTGVFLTERGQFILKMIEADIAQFMASDSLPKRRGKRTAA